MLILLFLFFIILLFMTYYLFDKDFMAPSFIIVAMYIVSIGVALLNYKEWGLSDYSSTTFFIVLGGAILFILVGFVVKLVVYPSNYQISPSLDVTLKQSHHLRINKPITIVLTIINVIIVYLWAHAVRNIVGSAGSFSQMMESFRAITSYSIDPTESIPGYIQQLSKVPTVSGYVYGFVLCYNLALGSIKKQDWFWCLPNVMLYVILSIFSSNRLNLLGLIGAYIIYFYVTRQEVITKSDSLKSFLKLFSIFVLVLLVFYAIRILVGRRGSANTGFMDYISLYIGAPVKLLDLFIKQPIYDLSIWGKETFVSINGTLRDLGFNIPKYLMHKEFRIYNGIELGNVYSAYRSWYADFGVVGVIILQSLLSTFYNIYYYLMKKKGFNSHKILFLLYGYFSMALFLHPIEDWFYPMFIAVGTVIYIVLFIFIYKLVIVGNTSKVFFNEK